MKVLKALLFGFFLLLIISFSIKNTGNTQLRYFGLFDPIHMPLFFLVILSIFFGMLIGMVADLMRRYRLRKATRRQATIMDELQKEIFHMRHLLLGEIDKEKENGSGHH
jgi:uncharacterized integral membrane protein